MILRAKAVMEKKRNKAPGELLIGEAALSLLDAKKPVSLAGILRRLEVWLAEEQDESRVRIFETAIHDVRAEMQRRSSDRNEVRETLTITSSEDLHRLTRH